MPHEVDKCRRNGNGNCRYPGNWQVPKIKFYNQAFYLQSAVAISFSWFLLTFFLYKKVKKIIKPARRAGLDGAQNKKG